MDEKKMPYVVYPDEEEHKILYLRKKIYTQLSVLSSFFLKYFFFLLNYTFSCARLLPNIS